IFKCDWSSDVCSSDLPWIFNQFWEILKTVLFCGTTFFGLLLILMRPPHLSLGVSCTGKEGNSMDAEMVWEEQAVVVHNLQTSFSEVYPHFHTVIVVIKSFKEWISALR